MLKDKESIDLLSYTKLINTLQQPFPRPDRNVIRKILHSFFEGLGVFLFFLIFQPFGMSVWEDENKSLYLAAYGVIVFGVTVLYRVLLPVTIPGFFEEKTWVVWKEILGIIFILGLISFLIGIYHQVFFKDYDNDYKRAGVIFFLVMVIGSIPVTVSVLSRFTYLYRKYEREIQVIKGPDPVQEKLILRAENEKDVLVIEELLFIESADNYCSVFFLQEGKVKKELIRSSLSRLESQIKQKEIIRCHRSYIVNLKKVNFITGNAQGYRLFLDGTSDYVPVSRKYSAIVDSFHPKPCC